MRTADDDSDSPTAAHIDAADGDESSEFLQLLDRACALLPPQQLGDAALRTYLAALG